MFLTEEEAKTKWCPMSRTGMMFATNRSENGCINKEDNCLASACMTWRYLNPEYVKNTKEDKDLSGYCGLAGKP